MLAAGSASRPLLQISAAKGAFVVCSVCSVRVEMLILYLANIEAGVVRRKKRRRAKNEAESGPRTRGRHIHAKHITDYLKKWLAEHKRNPYPTKGEKVGTRG